MSESIPDNALLRAIAGARRAQARQHAITRNGLQRVVTSDEFTQAMVEISNLFEGLEEILEQRLDYIDAQLGAIATRLISATGQ